MDAKEIVKNYLDERAKADELFAEAYKNPKKNMDECWKFILGEARKKGSAVCMSDAEVFGMAVHYYDEKNLKVEKVHEDVKVETGITISELRTKIKAAKDAEEKKGEEKSKKKKYTRKEVEEKRKKIEELQLDLFA